jgi:hypothetical protein
MAALNPLPRGQRIALYASIALLATSGLAQLGLHYTVGAGAGELPHPLEPWLLRLHGAAAMAALFTFGSLAAHHAPRGWRMGRQRRGGAGLWALLALLAASGWVLYYAANEATRPAIGLLHAGLGLVLTLGVLWHRRGVGAAAHHEVRRLKPLHPHPHPHHRGHGREISAARQPASSPWAAETPRSPSRRASRGR